LFGILNEAKRASDDGIARRDATGASRRPVGSYAFSVLRSILLDRIFIFDREEKISFPFRNTDIIGRRIVGDYRECVKSRENETL